MTGLQHGFHQIGLVADFPAQFNRLHDMRFGLIQLAHAQKAHSQIAMGVALAPFGLEFYVLFQGPVKILDGLFVVLVFPVNQADVVVR